MTDIAVEAIKAAGRPLTLRELEEAVRASEWQHTQEPKSEHQLRASLSALPHKSTRLRRVARGVYDVTG